MSTGTLRIVFYIHSLFNNFQDWHKTLSTFFQTFMGHLAKNGFLCVHGNNLRKKELFEIFFLPYLFGNWASEIFCSSGKNFSTSCQTCCLSVQRNILTKKTSCYKFENFSFLDMETKFGFSLKNFERCCQICFLLDHWDNLRQRFFWYNQFFIFFDI